MLIGRSLASLRMTASCLGIVRSIVVYLLLFNSAHAAVINSDLPPRIISLAPHLTEMLIDIGADKYLVGISESSSKALESRNLPIVSNASFVNLERILALHPTLVIAWKDSHIEPQLNQLRRLGVHVYTDNIQHLPDIATTLLQLGKLTSTQTQAQSVAHNYLQQLQTLQYKYKHPRPIKVFYEIWSRPLFTIGKKSLINEVIELCGGTNIFAKIPNSAFQVNLESVLAANPQVILTSVIDEQLWRQWPKLQAVKNHHLYYIPPDLLQQNSPKILLGIKKVCQYLMPI